MMKAKFFARLILSLAVCCSVERYGAAADSSKSWPEYRKRLEAESIALFQAVLDAREKQAKRKPVPCELKADWFNYDVPQEVGEKYFGLTIPADLSPAHTPGDPKEILDPKGIMHEAFCTEEEDREKLRTILERLKKGELRDDEQPSKYLKRYQNQKLGYSIPIFDRSFHKAAIVGSERTNLWWMKPDGKIYNDWDEVIWASIYVKRKGRWRFLKDVSIAGANGGAPPQ